MMDIPNSVSLNTTIKGILINGAIKEKAKIFITVFMDGFFSCKNKMNSVKPINKTIIVTQRSITVLIEKVTPSASNFLSVMLIILKPVAHKNKLKL